MEGISVLNRYFTTTTLRCGFGDNSGCRHGVCHLPRFATVLLISLLSSAADSVVAQTPVGHFADITPVLVDPMYIDYSPTVTGDELTMIFTSGCGWAGSPPCRPGHQGGWFDLYMATRTNTEESFGNVRNLGPPVNSPNSSWSEEGSSISPDGETLYFGAWRGVDYDLYQAIRVGDGPFGNVTTLGPGINTGRMEDRPSISADGRTIYYEDATSHVTGQARIWSANRPSTDVPFGNAHDLGDDLNGPPGLTMDDSRWKPSVSADERFLFFHIGGDDVAKVWVSTRATTDDAFGPPLNIDELWPGTEINGSGPAGYVHISTNWPAPGSIIYFCSERSGQGVFQATWVTDVGDFNANGILNVGDIDLLSAELRKPTPSKWFDLNSDKLVDVNDVNVWVKDLKKTWIGDADVNLEFNSSDFVQVFTVGKYETEQPAVWSEGDWNADGIFESGDFVVAFQDGGYEMGPRTDVAAVPEPATAALMLAAACLLFSRIRAELRRLTLLLALLCVPFCTAHADVRRWDTGEVIPGTEGITPGPGVQLDHRQLEYAQLQQLNLTSSNFGFSNLANAVLGWSTLTDASLTRANLTNANLLSSTLTNANLTGANLTNADLGRSTLTDANLTGAVVTGTAFWDTTALGFTAAQLYSTQSYEAKDLNGIRFSCRPHPKCGIPPGCGCEGFNDLTGWDFRGQNLTNADLTGSTLTDANLTGAVVTGADFGRYSDGLRWHGTGLTSAQLASTASYRAKDLRSIGLSGHDLTGWDFSGQNLANANLSGSTPTNANLTGAHLRNVNLDGTTGLDSAIADATTAYNQWTRFPAGFDPTATGLTMAMSPTGDLDADDARDADDVDMLANRIGGRSNRLQWLPGAAFDMNDDSTINLEDHRVWVKDLKHTWFGDANLDGEFNSSDFLEVFVAGTYERAPIRGDWGIIRNPASWSEGDWNGDGIFNSSDFVIAFQDGGYEQGPRPDGAAVPEPGAWTLLVIGLSLWLFSRRTCAI